MGSPVVKIVKEGGAWDDDVELLVLTLDGKELGTYCIVEDPEGERADLQEVVDAIYAAGLRDQSGVSDA